MSGNEYASRCHSHQQKVIANRHEFDTYPLSSTHFKPRVSVGSPGFVCVSGALVWRDASLGAYPPACGMA